MPITHVLSYKTGTGTLTPPVSFPFSSVSLQTPFDSTFADVSQKNQTVTAQGGASINTTTKKYGAGSAYFDGTNDYANAGTSVYYDIGGDDFTVEAWINAAPATGGGVDFDRGIFGRMGTGTAFFFLTNNNLTPGIWNGTTAAYANTTITPDTWQHIAWSRTSGVLKMFIDGVTVYTGSYTGNLGHSLNSFYIGGNMGLNNRYFKGYIDDLRVTYQGGRYIDDFAPPTAAFPTS